MSDSLIISADDFGITQAVTNAILEVYRNGSITSASLMAHTPATTYAAQKALEHPELGVGLHFTLTEMFPLASVPGLVGADGRFGTRKTLLRKALTGRLDRNEVLRELGAQYARLLDLGIRVTHVDSHQHVHSFPVIFEAVRDFCIAHRLPARLPHTQMILRRGTSLSGKMLVREAKHVVLGGMLAWCNSRRLSLPTNGSFNSIFDIYPSRLPSPEDYRLLVGKRRSALHEVMVHPYQLSPEVEKVYPDKTWIERKSGFFTTAEAEYRALSSFSIRAWLQQESPEIELVHYGSLT